MDVVYIVVKSSDYEGDEILKIFKSESKANKYVKERAGPNAELTPYGYRVGDCYTIWVQAVEVNQ